MVAWSFVEKARLPSVGFNNRKAMAELARKVIEAGHRRIAMISALTQGNDRALNRVMGVKDVLLEMGLEPDALTLIETPYEIEKGATAFAELMSLAPRPTAVICGNDVLAAGALHEARRRGISVPNQVSITGFEDIELSEIATPALTTVHVPHHEMGRKAAGELIAMVEGTSNGNSTCISTYFVSRCSLTKAPTDPALP